jgi:Flp pilus assembly pilin Flp
MTRRRETAGPSPTRALSQFRREERGAETVELAVTFLLVAVILFAGLELGWAMSQSSSLRHVARVGAREASLQGGSAAQVMQRVEQGLSELGISGANIELVPADPAAVPAGGSVEVRISVDYESVELLGLQSLMPLPDELQGRASMIKEPVR